MNHFEYVNGVMHAEGVALSDIAAQVGTPFYCYSTATLTRHYRVFAEALQKAGLRGQICFAMKANSNQAVVKTMANLGAGADVVSEGELRQALVAGVPASKIVFSGVGKSRAELEFAVSQKIMQINVESIEELDMLSEVAQAAGVVMPIALRVNPDVDAGTHAKITTGKKENKFGIDWDHAVEAYEKAKSLPGLDVAAIACHIGSQLTEITPFELAFAKVRELVATLRAKGFDIRRLDLGGGLGVPYDNEEPPHPDTYAQALAAAFGDLGCEIVLEPGRLLVGNAGVLVSKVVRVKQGPSRVFVIVDAAMNDLMRPALYEAYHAIVPVQEPSASAVYVDMDVVGPVCETGDTFAKDRNLPPIKDEDLLVFKTAGAYGASMSNTYNTRQLVPEVLVNEDRFAVIRRRPTYEEMRQLEAVPDWLK